MSKRFLACAVALLLMVSLFAVGTAEETKTFNVVYIPGEVANESQGFSAKMFEKHAGDYNLNVTIMDGQGDAQIQAQRVTNCIAQGVDAIFVNPNDINGIVPSLMEAKAAGIIVGLFSSDLAPEFQEYRDFFVGVDDNSAGVTAGEAFITAFPDGAKIVEVGGQAGHDAQIKRHDGFIEAITGSNITVLDSQSCNTWSTSDAMSITEDFIIKYGDEIQGVFCHWDNGATGVIEALKAAGMDEVFIIAVDGCRAGFDQVREGAQYATIMQNFETQAQKSLELAKAILDGGEVEAINLVPLDTVTLENIDEFTTPEW
ncbi:rhizopine-binding protein [Clostridia bacterium]|nr:rhizopine-binding protein [Clostridia bacterium]